jgi:hypothetical protein
MFDAHVARVLISSPGDVVNGRAVLREAVEDWNALNAERGVVLLTVLWERDATPLLGAPPQHLINQELVDDCDIVVAVFWTRLGTPTADHESGSVEEIERSIGAGKPVLVYFSSEPVVPESIDADEYKRLVEFRESLKSRGLLGSFGTPEELRRKVSADLTRVVRDSFGGQPVDPVEIGPRGADLLATVHSEREVQGFSSGGRARYSTRWTLAIENRGSRAAENLTVRLEAPPGEEMEAPMLLESDSPVSNLPPGAVITYHMVVAMQMTPQFEVIMEWQEDGEARSQSQSARL